MESENQFVDSSPGQQQDLVSGQEVLLQLAPRFLAYDRVLVFSGFASTHS